MYLPWIYEVRRSIQKTLPWYLYAPKCQFLIIQFRANLLTFSCGEKISADQHSLISTCTTVYTAIHWAQSVGQGSPFHLALSMALCMSEMVLFFLSTGWYLVWLPRVPMIPCHLPFLIDGLRCCRVKVTIVLILLLLGPILSRCFCTHPNSPRPSPCDHS